MANKLKSSQGVLGCSALALMAFAGSCSQKLPDKPNKHPIPQLNVSRHVSSRCGNSVK